MSNPRWLIGLSCGSSGQGIDAALVETTGVGLSIAARHVASLRRPFPREVQELFSPGISPPAAGVAHRVIGETAVTAVQQLGSQARVDPSRVLAAGFLGPLQWHEPDGRSPSTRELGMTSLVADRLGLSVVGDFREQDVASGGQGMPPSALVDSLIFRHTSEERLLIHLGGVSSVVYLPAGGRVQNVLAFEAGPCNHLLDSVIRQGTGGKERFDAGGHHAVQGRCLEPLLTEWQRHSFLQRKPPKSLPRSDYGPDFIQDAVKRTAALNGTLQDLLCSLSHHIIDCIVSAARRWLPAADKRTVYLSGGGVRNGMFWRLIEQQAPEWKRARFDELGVPAQARNATAAAMLAALTLDGVPASTPSATGAVGRLLGRLTPGGSTNWARCLRWMSENCSELTLPYRAA
jgi:anhydro-N-acetylmuramic acid kinase